MRICFQVLCDNFSTKLITVGSQHLTLFFLQLLAQSANLKRTQTSFLKYLLPLGGAQSTVDIPRLSNLILLKPKIYLEIIEHFGVGGLLIWEKGYLSIILTIVAEQKLPLQNTSLWHKDYIRLIIFNKLQIQEKL